MKTKNPKRVERIALAVLATAVAGFLAYRFTVVPSESADAAITATSPEDALASLEQATVDNPSNITAWQDLGATYVELGLQQSRPEYFTKGQEALDRADEIVLNDAPTLVARASLAVTRHEFGQAEAFASEALESLPYDSKALAARVDSQIETGEYQQALLSAEDFADRRPGGAALARISYLRQLNGDMPGALAALSEADVAVASSGPYQRATMKAIRGDVYMKMGDIARAERAYEEAVEIMPGHVVGSAGLAQVHARTLPIDEAILELETIVAEDATFGTVDLLLALYEQQGNEARAQQMIDVYATLVEGERMGGAVVDLEAAVFEAANGSPAEAVALARKAYAEQPNIFAADALAWSLHKAGENEEALTYSDEAMRLGTLDAQFFAHSAAINASLGNTETATEMLTTAAEINPLFSLGEQPELRSLAAELNVPWPS